MDLTPPHPSPARRLQAVNEGRVIELDATNLEKKPSAARFTIGDDAHGKPGARDDCRSSKIYEGKEGGQGGSDTVSDFDKILLDGKCELPDEGAINHFLDQTAPLSRKEKYELEQERILKEWEARKKVRRFGELSQHASEPQAAGRTTEDILNKVKYLAHQAGSRNEGFENPLHGEFIPPSSRKSVEDILNVMKMPVDQRMKMERKLHDPQMAEISCGGDLSRVNPVTGWMENYKPAGLDPKVEEFPGRNKSQSRTKTLKAEVLDSYQFPSDLSLHGSTEPRRTYYARDEKKHSKKARYKKEHSLPPDAQLVETPSGIPVHVSVIGKQATGEKEEPFMHAVPRGDGTYDWTPEPFKPFKVNPPPASLFRDEGFVSYQDSALKKGELYHIKEHRRGQAAARRAKGYVGGFQYGKGLQGNPEALAAAYSQKARDLSGVLGDGFPGVLNPAYKPGQDNQVAAYQEYLTRERKENEDMKIRGRYD